MVIKVLVVSVDPTLASTLRQVEISPNPTFPTSLRNQQCQNLSNKLKLAFTQKTKVYAPPAAISSSAAANSSVSVVEVEGKLAGDVGAEIAKCKNNEDSEPYMVVYDGSDYETLEQHVANASKLAAFILCVENRDVGNKVHKRFSKYSSVEVVVRNECNAKDFANIFLAATVKSTLRNTGFLD